MLVRFRKLLQAPKFDDPEKNVQAQNINTILLFTLVLTVIYLFYAPFGGPTDLVIAIVAIFFELGLLLALKKGYVQFASIFFTTFLWVAIVSLQYSYGGVRDSGFASFAIVIAMASLTMGIWGGVAYTSLTILAGIGFILGDNAGLLPARQPVTAGIVLLSYSITFTAVLLLLFLAVRNVSATAKKAIEGEIRTREANEKLENSNSELEERTVALELRNATLNTVSEVARLTSQAKTENELANQVVNLLSQRIKVEHIGMFLMDEPGDFAYLAASNSTEGKSLIEEKYRLKVASGELAYIFADSDSLQYLAGTEIIYISRPAPLPDTKANFNYPFVSGPNFVGVLNIQTISPDPQFIEEQTMQAFADQIALSISNIRLVSQMQSRLQEIGRIEGNTVQKAWEQMQGDNVLGFNYDRIQVQHAGETIPSEINDQLRKGRSATYTTSGNSPRAKLVAPIILRENTIGVIGYEDNDPNRIWHEDEKALLETVASRVGLALENTRLFSEAQQRAERERTLGKVASRMRETLDIDTMLQTAVREMKRSLNLKQAEVRLQLATPQPATQKLVKRDKGAGA
jgi:GAF domain-containing protein/Na+-transporting methylmalonyl-CoA/oxaloacetate decarboxylase gamma subunit